MIQCTQHTIQPTMIFTSMGPVQYQKPWGPVSGFNQICTNPTNGLDLWIKITQKKGPIHLPNPVVAPRDGPTARCTWRFHAHLVHLIITLYVYVYYVCAHASVQELKVPTVSTIHIHDSTC